ncbi:MAG: radical SAM protein [Myxococcota bacterium]|nr:radical SAM protein [Myxococcota bacterium]
MDLTLLKQHGLVPSSAPPAGFVAEDVASRPTRVPQMALTSLALDVSGGCNLRCRYCAEQASQPQRRPMEDGLISEAIRLLGNNCPEGSRGSVRLGSGEPLLALPQLRRLEAEIEACKASLDVFLTTNGMLVDDTTADWLAATDWRLKVSLDGPPDIHNAWRVDASGKATFAHVSAAVQRLVDRCADRVSATAVLCRRAQPKVVFDSIAALGVRRIELVCVATNDKEILLSAEDVLAYHGFVQQYADTLIGADLETQPMLVGFEEAARRAMGYANTDLPCGAGRTLAGVDADGALYPCFRFVGLEAYRLGYLRSGLEPQLQHRFCNSVGCATGQRQPCQDCWAQSLCGGPCFSVAAFFGPGAHAPSSLHCAIQLANARAAVKYVTRQREIDAAALLPLLPIEIPLP